MAADPAKLASSCHEVATQVKEHVGPEAERHLNELEESVKRMLDLACSHGCPSAQTSHQGSPGDSEGSQAHMQDSGINALLDAMCKVEDVLSQAVKWLHKGSTMSAEIVGLMEEIAEAMRTLHSQQQESSMFAELGDHIADFRLYVVDEVEAETGMTSWDQLGRRLRREEREPEHCGQQTTNAVKAALGRLGFTWEEWVNLRTLSGHAVGLFHQGQSQDYDKTLQKLSEVQLPVSMQEVGQQGCKAAACKVIDFLKRQPA